jgi:hypothetical protein
MTPDRTGLLDRIRSTTDDALACYDLGRDALVRSYAPGKWTGRQLLLHLCDAETVLLDRLRRLAADERPLLWAYDENRWANLLRYDQRSVAVAKGLFASARAAVLDLVASLPAEALDRSGVHSEAGTRSFAQVAEMVAWHTAHHVEQLQAIAGGRSWPGSARA